MVIFCIHFFLWYLYRAGFESVQLGNHLGNVLVTISDKKKGVADPLNAALIKFFEPYMLSGTDYYPFGMPMRVGGDNKYKYGFNGKENDNEVKGGDGLQQDYGMRVYDNRLGRFLSVDPLTSEYTDLTPYQYASNSPIANIDIDGLEGGWSMSSIPEKLKREGDLFVELLNNKQVSAKQQPAGLDLSQYRMKKASYEGTSWFWTTLKVTVFTRNSVVSGYNQALGTVELTSQVVTKKGRVQLSKNIGKGLYKALMWYLNSSDDEKLDDIKAVATDVNTYEDLAGGFLISRGIKNFRGFKTIKNTPPSIAANSLTEAERRVTSMYLGGDFEAETIGKFTLSAYTRMVGKTFQKNIVILLSDKQQNIFTLIKDLETQARNAGAKRIEINGLLIQEEKLLNEAAIKRLGYTYEQLDKTTISLSKDLK